MKKLQALILIGFCLFGCANYNVEVRDTETIIYVDNQIAKRIVLDNSFQYIGVYPFTSNYTHGKYYHFAKSNTENVDIAFYKSKFRFMPVNLTQNIIDNGYVDSGGKKYFYLVIKKAQVN